MHPDCFHDRKVFQMYRFYYDETEHSRSITKGTVEADNFFDGFVTVTVGWKDSDEDQLKNKYIDFEKKYRSPGARELKSTSINNNQLKNGFASLSKSNVALYTNLLDLCDSRVLLYYTHASKIEFIIRQILNNYSLKIPSVYKTIVYIISKAITQYRPAEVISALYGSSAELLDALRLFFQNQLLQDATNYPLKFREIGAFEEILLLLNSADPPKKLDWNYKPPFDGFMRYLKHHGINDYSLTIDREANTAAAAKSVGLSPVDEGDSINFFGLRVADMVAGLIAKLMKAFTSATRYTDEKSRMEKKLLPSKWFTIDDRRLHLYHALYRMLVENENC